MPVRIDHAITSGTFSLDGGTWDVDNNVWVLGDDAECVVIDAPHDPHAIAALIGDRRLVAILCTHAHDDHVGAARALAESFDAPVRLHADDEPLWRLSYPDFGYLPLSDGEAVGVGGVSITALHTPGHAPGAVCYHVPELATLFSGDTLFAGGPGATGRSFSDFPTIISSITGTLLTLPPETLVRTGHGDDTTIAAELPHVAEWIARGH